MMQCSTTARLNPFSNPKVREAVNWLIDRNYIAQEGMGGLGTPRYVPILSTFPDYPAMPIWRVRLKQVRLQLR